MIMTLEDGYTDNPDERVPINVELLCLNYRVYQNTIAHIGREIMTPTRVMGAYNQVKAFTNVELVAITVKVIDKPFIVIRGTEIDTDHLVFDCEYRSRWVGHEAPNNDRGYLSSWSIFARVGGYGVSAFQNEQLLLRYQQSILPILEDKETHSIIVMYTISKLLDMCKETVSRQIMGLETTMEHIELIEDGSFDEEETAQ